MNHLVCSRETAERMRTLGFPQKSLFWYVMWHSYSMVLPGPSWEVKYTGELVDWKDDEYIAVSAYLAGEVAEWLPDQICDSNEDLPYFLTIKMDNDRDWWIDYIEDDRGGSSSVYSKNLSEAICLMLIQLAEQGVIDPKKL